MKNLFKIGTLALVLVAVSGCGSSSKNLTCTNNSTISGMEVDTTVKATFKGKEATKIKMSIDMKVPDSYKSYMSTIERSLKSKYSEFDDAKGVSYTTSVKDTTVSLTLDANLKEMSDSTKSALNFDGATGTYDDAKKAFEDSGYTCK